MTAEIAKKEDTSLDNVATIQAGAVDHVITQIREYAKLQKALDAELPQCLVTLDGKPFRKKQYWAAVAVALGVECVLVEERREDHGEDWGYCVVYKAVGGRREAYGDGACFRSEKLVYQKTWHNRKPTVTLDKDGQPMIDVVKSAKQATVHNVRAHAHTRARGRAISNLVGFGEVTAEEVSQDENTFVTTAEPAPAPEDKELTKAKEVFGGLLHEWAKRMHAQVSSVSEEAHFKTKRGMLTQQVLGLEKWPADITAEQMKKVVKALEADLAVVMGQPKAEAEPAAAAEGSE